jgi:hypothetical protein
MVRFLARWRVQNSSIGWDDWIILLAWVGLLPSTILVRIMTYHGMGKDIWNVEPNGITLMLKLFYIEQYIYQLVIVATKISIVLLYLRIFPKEVSRRFQYTSWAVIAGLLAYLAGFFIYFSVECRPISYFWHQWDGEHEGTCPDTESAIYVNSAFNIFFDLIVFFLPVPRLMSLQIKDTRRKVGVVLTFLVGLFVTICSIVRLRYLAAFGRVTNATYHFNDIALWSGLEGDVGVICACMPTIAGPILYFFREKVGSKLSSNTKSYTGGTGKSPNSSRITGNKSITRLPSTASERDIELDKRPRKHGGIEKTTVTSMHNLPHHCSSEDDVELIHQNVSPKAKNQWEV